MGRNWSAPASRRQGFAASVLAGLVAVSAVGCGGTIDQFAATQVVSRKGRIQHSSKLYIAGQKMRVEMPHPSGRGSLVTIVRQDKGVVWILFPDQKAYRETAIDEAELGAMARQITDEQVVEELGSETVAGYPCRKVKTRTQVTMGGRTIEATSTAWISKQLSLPLRTEHQGGSASELREITPGRQSAELFELPGDYKKVEGMLPGYSAQGREQHQGEQGNTSLADKLRKLTKPN